MGPIPENPGGIVLYLNDRSIHDKGGNFVGFLKSHSGFSDVIIMGGGTND